MRVKIDDIWYDSEDQPIAIQVNAGEQSQIAGMHTPGQDGAEGKYAIFPGDWTVDEMKTWMEG